MTKSSTLIVSLLIGGSIFALGVPSHTVAAKTFAPKGGWQILNYENPTDAKGSYCALSKQYKGDIALTFGKNLLDEYSAALDFTVPNLDTNRAYNVKITPKDGQERSYNIRPASKRAFVINLGSKDDIFRVLVTSELLKIEIDDKKYDFKIPDMSVGQKQLNECVASLNAYNPKQKFASQNGFSAEKEAPSDALLSKPTPPPSKPTPVAQAEVAQADIIDTKDIIEQQVPQLSENAIVARISDTAPDIKEITVTPPVISPTNAELDKKISIIKSTISDPIKPVAKPPVIEIAKTEIIKETPTIESAPAIEVAPTIKAAPVQKAPIIVDANQIDDSAFFPEPAIDLEDDIIIAKPVQPPKANTDVELTVGQLPKAAVKPIIAEKSINQTTSIIQPSEAGALKVAKRIELEDSNISIAQGTSKKEGTVSRALGRIASVTEKIMPKKSVTPPAVAPIAEPEITAQYFPEVQTTAEELPKLAPEPEIKAQYFPEVQPAPTAEQPIATSELSGLKDDLMALERQQATEKARRDALSQKIDIQKDIADKAEREALIARIATLEAENRKFYEDAKQARAEIDKAVIEVANKSLDKTRDIRSQLEAAKSDNIRLSKELEEVNKLQENALVNAAASDPNLQKTLQRNNEAERELKRLGTLMKQQRLSWDKEREELEKMLFDPAVTEDRQRKKLVELESKLSATQEQLAEAKSYADKAAKERVIVASEQPAPTVIASAQAPRLSRAGVSTAPTSLVPNAISRQVQPALTAQAPESQVSREALAPALTANPAPIALAPVARVMQRYQVSQNDIKNLLSRAGVPLKGSIIRVSDNQFRWDASNIIGKALIEKTSDVGGVQNFAQSTIATAKKACGGDFAAVPASHNRFEMACVGGVYNSSYSLVLHQKGQEIIAITHETSVDDMDIAMDIGDKISKNLSAL